MAMGPSRTKYAHLNDHPPPLRGPKLPVKELILSLVLFAAGTTFLLCGANVFFRTSLSESIPFTLLGALCFIPGSYHSFIFLMVFRKVPGYSYDMITTFEN
mmetsp:Transcript_107106/g.302883  ORF Transcript_107106/g.302883 Transcript_107106/m.302883 type:complete len:101 (-) Transcript_107106:111-413(-)